MKLENGILKFILLIAFSALIFSCKKEGQSAQIPELWIPDSPIIIAEDDPSLSAKLTLFLSNSYDKPVSISYTTSDSLNSAGKDYIAVENGQIVFQPGELSKTVKIDLMADTAMKKDLYISVTFHDPVNTVIKNSKTIIKVLNVDYNRLVWSDEFNTETLNTSVWNYEKGAGGWGNNELETYTSSTDNVSTQSGFLYIKALNPSSGQYTSGRITTKDKKEFTYGKIEIRAKLPEGKGIWPALWMLGSNITTAGWPACGEIDIMELLGDRPSTVYGTIHWNNNGHQSKSSSWSLQAGKFSSDFHVFTFLWTPNKMIWYVDGNEYTRVSRYSATGFPFDLRQFFIFNVAVGGNWPGNPDVTTVFPQSMVVDYIRLYQ